MLFLPEFLDRPMIRRRSGPDGAFRARRVTGRDGVTTSRRRAPGCWSISGNTDPMTKICRRLTSPVGAGSSTEIVFIRNLRVPRQDWHGECCVGVSVEGLPRQRRQLVVCRIGKTIWS
jgi:hypothetical protein